MLGPLRLTILLNAHFSNVLSAMGDVTSGQVLGRCDLDITSASRLTRLDYDANTGIVAGVAEKARQLGWDVTGVDTGDACHARKSLNHAFSARATTRR